VPAWARWHGIVAPSAILPIPKFWDNMKNEKKEKEKKRKEDAYKPRHACDGNIK
jgi:hypothetical protein